MIEYTRTLLWIVCAVMALGMAGTAWGQEGLAEFGGDGECPNEDCKVDGGGDVELPEPCYAGLCDIYIEQAQTNFTVLVPDSDTGDLSGPLYDLGVVFESISPGFSPVITESTVSFERLDTICISEWGHAISLVGVENNKEGLYAKIRKISQLPMGGRITVRLNSDTPNYPGPITILTTQGSIAQTNAALVTAIEQSLYQVVETAHYIIVTQDGHLGSGLDLNQVSFETTDPGIIFSEVALEDDDHDSTKCND